MYYIGILIHGLIFGFFFVGGQIYIDKKAPPELRSQAQGFIFLVTFGVGLLVGNIICGRKVQIITKVLKDMTGILYRGLTTLSSVVLLVFFIYFLKRKKKSRIHFLSPPPRGGREGLLLSEKHMIPVCI